MAYTCGSLCSGFGGLEMAAELAGIKFDMTWYAEHDTDDYPTASAVMAHHHPGLPNLGDITAVDWSQVEPVEILTAGYPCQDLSNAGKRAGIEGDRSGIWRNVADAVRVLRPRLVILENVAAHIGRGFGRVLGDLAACGYDARWVCVRASAVGAPHQRDRVFIVAYPQDGGWEFGSAEPARPHGSLTALLPTPTATDARSSSGANPAWNHGVTLTDAARSLLPTPCARDGNGRGEGTPEYWASRDTTGIPLGAAVNLLPTPRTTDGTKGSPNQHGTNGDLMLPSAVQPQRWGVYAQAVARWETVMGTAPVPTVKRPNGNHALSPLFVEWMMGLPAGHVTDVPGLSRKAMLHCLGNGVVPQQGAYALRLLGVTR